MVGERAKGVLEREPIRRKASRRVKDAAYNVRSVPSEKIMENVPEFEERNMGGGLIIGTALAGIGVIIEDAVGVPFGASSDIIDTEPVDGGVRYTVNVNAPTRAMADSRAAIDSTTGFSSFITDGIEIEDIELMKKRFARDTYQVTLTVKD